MLPTVSGQFVQMVVQGCHNPHVQQVHRSRCQRLRHLIRHNLFLLPVHYFGNPGCTLCLSGFDGFQQLHYSDISDSALCSADVQLLEANLFCVSTHVKLSHHLCSLIGTKGLVMKCERQQVSSCHHRVSNVIQMTAKTTYNMQGLLCFWKDPKVQNTHMKMLFSVCCLNKQGHIYKVTRQLVIIRACLFFSWMSEHDVFLKF